MFAPCVPLLEVAKRAARDEIASPIGHFQSQTLMTIEQHPRIGSDSRETLQIGNYHDWKLQPFRLVNRHQSYGVRSLIDLSFTFATPDRFKLLNVTHEVANQMRPGAFETRRECEQALNIRKTLRAVEVGGNDSRELRLFNCEAQ